MQRTAQEKKKKKEKKKYNEATRKKKKNEWAFLVNEERERWGVFWFWEAFNKYLKKSFCLVVSLVSVG